MQAYKFKLYLTEFKVYSKIKDKINNCPKQSW